MGCWLVEVLLIFGYCDQIAQLLVKLHHFLITTQGVLILHTYSISQTHQVAKTLPYGAHYLLLSCVLHTEVTYQADCSALKAN